MSGSTCQSALTCKNTVQTPRTFCYIRVLPVAVARSSSGDNALRFVLPVLWMTSRLSVVGQANATPIGQSTWLTSDSTAGRSLMPIWNHIWLSCDDVRYARLEVTVTVLIYTYLLIVSRDIPLKLGLNEYSNYTKPQNLDFLGPNFIYYGFIPASLAQNNNQQGLQVCVVRSWFACFILWVDAANL